MVGERGVFGLEVGSLVVQEQSFVTEPEFLPCCDLKHTLVPAVGCRAV